MIKIWCETCKGTREQLNQNPFNVIRMLCPDCNGKGYTEHDGSLEDLELAQAISEFCKHTGDKLYYYDFMDNLIEITPEEFINWYREQKRGAE